MPAITEDTSLIQQALAYAIELYRELSEENGPPASARRTRWSISSWPIRSCAQRSRIGGVWSRAARRRPRRPGDCRVTPPTGGSGLI